jgi:DNA-binding YbaB/EbfC family protein
MAKGFNRLPGAGGGGGMMQQLKHMQEQMEQTQAQLADQTVTAGVGGGSVKVTMTGDQKCKSIEINPDVLKDTDVEMLQDLILSAVNQALELSEKLKEEKMAPFLGGLSGTGF